MSKSALHPAHALTLRIFAKRKLRPAQVADKTGVKRTVAHNRLESLRRKGLLDREFANPGWLYFRIAK